MSGAFNIGGLISGLDTNNIIEQLIQIERQPIIRLEGRVATLNEQRDAVRDVRTQLTTLLNRAQDFQFNNIFNQFTAPSSEESVLTAEISGANPVEGSFEVQVVQLASATVATSSAVLGSTVDPNASLNVSGMGTDVVAGDFTVNGVSFTVDPTTQSLNDVLALINASAAGVVATYDALTDTVTFENAVPGDTSLINFGATGDDSNFLTALNVVGATQTTGGNGATEVTSTRNLGSIDPGATLNTVSFAGGAATSGSFSINGIAITVDVTTDSVSDVIARINDSDAQVTASYDSATDTIRVVSDTLGSRTVRFTSGTSNFLDVTNLSTAIQTAGVDSQFRVNGGALQTRNTNEVDDAIGGVTLSFLSQGTSTVTVTPDDDAIVEDIQAFLDAFNESLTSIDEVTGLDGVLENDGTLRIIEDFLRSTIFSVVAGITGDYNSLVDVGITTGDAFDSSSLSQLELDEDTFRAALRDDRTNVADLFSNTGNTGIGDLLEDYLDDATSTTGFLNERIKTNGTIDQQIEAINNRIDRLEDIVAQREARLRVQFSQLEQLISGFQSQGAFLMGLSSGFNTLTDQGA